MIKKELLRFTLYAIIAYLTSSTLNPAVAVTQPSGGHETHVCGVIDDQWNKQYSDQYPNRHYARTFAANLNVGEPRTVRMIYFLPNDRPYRADIVQKMKDDILNIQTFFAEQMGVHGWGEKTFRVETDAQGAPKVHRMDGRHPNTHYLDNTDTPASDEVEKVFDLEANVYLIVIDNSRYGGVGGRWGKNGGRALVSETFGFELVAHELGHAFGLGHDFRDGAYVMSYGPEQDRLSACHAEFLSVHPYFNPSTSTREGVPPTIKLISSPQYTAGAQRVPVRLKVSDSDGLHQAILLATTVAPHGAAGSPEVKACRGLAGNRDTSVRFDYDGVIPSDGYTSLSDLVIHPIYVQVVDTDGNVSHTSFSITESSPYHIASLPGHADSVSSVSFSPDGVLASGSGDGSVMLWDVTTQQNIGTLEGHTSGVSSVAFSPDGVTLATGSWDGTVIWDVATQQDIGTLEGHTSGVSSVAFSPDGVTLATGSWDGTVKLWDVATQQDIGTLPHTDEVSFVVFSRDGSTLATGPSDGAVKLWDITTRVSFATLPHTGGVTSVSFSRDGAILATGSWDSTVKLWDVATQQDIGTLEGHTSGVNSVVFSPVDEALLATSSWDGAVKLWDITTRVSFATLPHTDEVVSVSFSPDGRTIASGTGAGTVELWASMLMDVRLETVPEINIPDPNLRAAIVDEIGAPPGTSIIRGRLTNLTHLEARNANITDLTGLESATNLTELLLPGNRVRDISPLSGLTNLKTLELAINSVTDISPLSGLTNLRTLGLSNSGIKDLSALISVLSNLTNLTSLYLSNNNIFDISAVAELTNLTELYLGNNSISDISAVVGLTNLQWLELGGNSISDISPLVENTGLGVQDYWNWVDVRENPLSYQSIHTHVPILQSRGVTVEFDNQTHPALLKISGDNQKGAPSTPLSQPFIVEAQDENGSALVGISVGFAVTAGGGTLSVTSTTTDAHGRAESTLTLGPNLGTNTVSVSATEIERVETFNAISDTLPTDYRLSIPAGISLIHVPLKVTEVNGAEQTIESIGDLYDALGGADTVNSLITYDSHTQGWFSYFGTSDKGTTADKRLTDDTGILANIKAPVSIRLSGASLGANGSSAITLNPGQNLVGLPLRDPRISHVSDLLMLEGIGGNVPAVILMDSGEFKSVGRAGDPGDILIAGGQSFILNAQRAATIGISGEGWYNVSGTTAAPLMALTGIQVTDTTPVLGLKGSIVAPDRRWGGSFRVIVKNLSTGKAVAAVTKDENYSRTDKRESAGVGYQVTIVDVETGRAAKIEDNLEISVRSLDPLIGVQPLRYTVTAEDVKRGLIQLTELVAYEIPTETELLHNYPNPFNPETWIPYRLAEDAFVTLTIYDQTGHVVRTLDVGHRIASAYESRSKAVYWDGNNGLGEQVASGIYFYTLTAGDYSATRKMVILK